jgi:hypothetical protein
MPEIPNLEPSSFWNDQSSFNSGGMNNSQNSNSISYNSDSLPRLEPLKPKIIESTSNLKFISTPSSSSQNIPYSLPDPPASTQKEGQANKRSFFKRTDDTIESLKSRFGFSGGFVSGIPLVISGERWPQTQTVNDYDISDKLKEMYPSWKTYGWLPPILCSPRSKDNGEGGIDTKYIVGPEGDYVYQDWRGHIIAKKIGVENPVANYNTIDTSERFNISLSEDMPRRTKEDLVEQPYSTRDLLAIFGDYGTDYFKHGLQIVDNIGTLPPNLNDFYKSGGSGEFRKSIYKGTPFENSDPVIYGFEIIIDDINSPLLNNSVVDFLNLLSNVSEIRARKKVYEEFKYHFTKFFKTKSTVRFDEEQLSITKAREFSLPESEKFQNLYENGKKAYKSYYLQSISGLSKLVEANTPTEKKAIVDYNKDVITLDFHESVSMSVGLLAHLYKLLYWSKPNSKGIVPENLLRFNCEIIISEMRNFSRIRKDVATGNLERVKDNLSRYIYSLRECQFYFDKLPHDDQIDLGSPKTFEKVQVQFDYKYSTVKFERFVPADRTINGPQKGKYVGYDAGAMWKVGNPGERDNRNATDENKKDTSIPKFYTENINKYNQNGVTYPLILDIPGGFLDKFQFINPINTGESESDVPVSDNEVNQESPDDSSSTNFQKAKKLAAKRTVQGYDLIKNSIAMAVKSERRKIINIQVRNLKGLLGKVSGNTGISAPRNIYKEDAFYNNVSSQAFYDIRRQVSQFGGEALGDVWNTLSED